jgi:uroporphyrinogen-III synthase
VRLLITRPQPDAERTAAALRAGGHEPIVAPLLRIEVVTQVDFGGGPWGAFLLTSINALRGFAGREFGDEIRRAPVFTVGERTAEAIRRHGFTSVASADGNVNDLANLVAGRLRPPARLLYLAGEDRAGDLAGELRAKGFAVETVVVYHAITADKLPQAAADALAGGIDGVLHYSRRSAEAYVDAARRGGVLASALKPAHICLSDQVAEPLVRAGALTIRVAPSPNETALLALVGPNTH